MKMTSWFLGAILLGGLWGCTPAYQTVGTQVELVPVTYQLTLASKESSPSFDAFTRFVSHHQTLILTQKISLSYSSPRGEKAAKKAQRYLLKRGVDSQNIQLYPSVLSDGDWRIAVVSYHIKPELCQPVTIADMHQRKTGCAIIHNQWLSKVRPERGMSDKEGKY